MEHKESWWRRNQTNILIGLAFLTIITMIVIYSCPKKDKVSILSVHPGKFTVYHPTKPQVPGQTKARIEAVTQAKNSNLAKNVEIIFTILDDGTGRTADSKEWDIEVGQKAPKQTMIYPDKQITTWTPDVPNDMKPIALNRKNPFKLKLTLFWQDIDDTNHQVVSFSELHYDEVLNRYYLSELENKWMY